MTAVIARRSISERNRHALESRYSTLAGKPFPTSSVKLVKRGRGKLRRWRNERKLADVDDPPSKVASQFSRRTLRPTRWIHW